MGLQWRDNALIPTQKKRTYVRLQNGKRFSELCLTDVPWDFCNFLLRWGAEKNGTQKLAAVCTGGNKVVVVLSHCSHSSSKLESFKKSNLRLVIQMKLWFWCLIIFQSLGPNYPQSSTFSNFHKAYEEEIWCLCTVTSDQKVPKLNSNKWSTARDFTVI